MMAAKNSSKVVTGTPEKHETFVSYMQSYLLREDQLKMHGFARPTSDPGVASIVRKPDEIYDIQPVGSNGLRHKCFRCTKPFIVYNDGSYKSERCTYHEMRLYQSRGRQFFPCCQGGRGSPGCQSSTMHVTRGAKPPLESGYVQTVKHPVDGSYKPTVYALDCEMCYTTAALEVTRVTVVNTDNESVYEKLVKPDNPITDYNTKFTGFTARDFVAVTTRLQDVQKDLLSLFYEDTILLGHSLESDLVSLKVIHSKIVDTSVVFPHHKGLPYKRALRNLARDHLHKTIQGSAAGHSSKEDAATCMELMMWKIKTVHSLDNNLQKKPIAKSIGYFRNYDYDYDFDYDTYDDFVNDSD